MTDRLPASVLYVLVRAASYLEGISGYGHQELKDMILQRELQVLAPNLQNYVYEPSIKTRGITSQQLLNYLRNILIEENTMEENRKRAENEFGLQKLALQKFTRFQKLPPELRNLVWNYAREEAAGPRVVEIRNTSGPRRYLQSSFPQARRTALFNLRRVNKEAYDVVMEKYTSISCRDLGMQPEGFKKHDHLLLHLKSDVVLFSSCWCHSDLYRSQVFKPRLESHAAKLEIVAVNVTSHNFEEMVRLFFQPILKGLKKIILNISRWDHRYCGLPISFTELRDKDDEDYKFFLGKWNEQIGHFEDLGYLKSVEVVVVKATRINPPKLLSMMVERRYNQKKYPNDASKWETYLIKKRFDAFPNI